ncbi:putative F-box protein At1g47390 [Hibiscus syriacus]|nr:putative F-box protein At1g47390 [Hibiscus syriacus]
MEMENNQVSSQDILELILSKLPLKPRTRFKCVSRVWNALITDLRHIQPPTTASGLVFSFKKPSSINPIYQLNLLEVVQDQSLSCFVHTSLTHELPWLIDSCNGLLLFGTKKGISLTYLVSSPVRNQWLKLPPPGHGSSVPVSASLAFDGVRQHFDVICQFWEDADIKNGTLKYQIFSSQSWQWREYNGKIHNSALCLSKDFNREEWYCPSLYCKGRMYWIWSLCLLVFNENKLSFELMELPKTKLRLTSLYCGKRLWESEDHLHYCDSTYVGFYIWERIEIDNRNDFGLKWRLKNYIRMDELVSRNYYPDDVVFLISPVSVKPCAFNDDLQILYFQLPRIIAAYSFETRKAVKILSDDAIGQSSHDNVFPFLFNAVDLHGWGR